MGRNLPVSYKDSTNLDMSGKDDIYAMDFERNLSCLELSRGDINFIVYR